MRSSCSLLTARQYTIRRCDCWSASRTREEAAAAAEGGADVIDAKDPLRGALGAVTAAAFDGIRRAVRQPTSAALGDAGRRGGRRARCARLPRRRRVVREDRLRRHHQPQPRLAAAVCRRSRRQGARRRRRLRRSRAGRQPGARHRSSRPRRAPAPQASCSTPPTRTAPASTSCSRRPALAAWIAAARQAGLFVAVAGKLTAERPAGRTRRRRRYRRRPRRRLRHRPRRTDLRRSRPAAACALHMSCHAIGPIAGHRGRRREHARRAVARPARRRPRALEDAGHDGRRRRRARARHCRDQRLLFDRRRVLRASVADRRHRPVRAHLRPVGRGRAVADLLSGL